MGRKVAVVMFAAAWAAFAYLVWPEGINYRDPGSLTIRDLLKLASIGSVALGVVLTVWTWRG